MAQHAKAGRVAHSQNPRPRSQALLRGARPQNRQVRRPGLRPPRGTVFWYLSAKLLLSARKAFNSLVRGVNGVNVDVLVDSGDRFAVCVCEATALHT